MPSVFYAEGISLLKSVHLLLGSHRRIVVLIVVAFHEHIVDHADGKQVKVTDADSQLDAPQQEERSRYLPAAFLKFCFDSACVCVFSPHSSMSCGRT